MKSKAKQVETEINRAGGKATFVRTDVSRPEEVEAMVRTAVEKYGRLDILFNNAGIEGKMALTADCSVEDWQKVIDINLTGVFLGMKYAIPAMLKNGGGSIINNSSTASIKITGSCSCLQCCQGRSNHADEDGGSGVRQSGDTGECDPAGCHLDAAVSTGYFRHRGDYKHEMH